MENTFKVEIYTPEKLFLNEETELLTVSGLDGEYGIMKNHIPCVIALKEGYIELTKNGEKRRLTADGGYLEMDNNRARIFVSGCKNN